MQSTKKIFILLIIVLSVSLLFVSCGKMGKKGEETVEIKADKIVLGDSDKIISAIQEKRSEPQVTVIVNVGDTKGSSVTTTSSEASQAVKTELIKSSEDTEVPTVKTATVPAQEVKPETVIVSEPAVQIAEEDEAYAGIESFAEDVIEEDEFEDIFAEESSDEFEDIFAEELDDEVIWAESDEYAFADEYTEEELLSAESELVDLFEEETAFPVEEKKAGAARFEVGAGAGYYHYNYNDYKAEMLKVALPIYFDLAASEKFSIAIYAKPAYLKELKTLDDSSYLFVEEDEDGNEEVVDREDDIKNSLELQCGIGIKTGSPNFSFRANFGVDAFNIGTKIEEMPKHLTLNLQLIPAIRLGNSKIWISIPVEGSISPTNSKHNFAYGGGVYVTLRTEGK